MIGGSLLVALLAIVVDLLLVALQKVVVSPGLQAVRAVARAGCARCPPPVPPPPRAA